MPEYQNETIGFAGRLDPLAHGVLLLMIGEETTKQREKYLNLPKEYVFEAIFGVSTDTYDVLGIVNNETIKQSNNDLQNLENQIKEFIKKKLGKQIQTYPPYSSKTVNGKPLYLWAREGKLHEIQIPTREIEIYDFQHLNIGTISATNLENKIMKQINSVDGDFRQNIIKKAWNNFFCSLDRHPELDSGSHTINKKIPDQVRNDNTKTFQTAQFKISCSSGTYIRSLISELGEYTGLEATALEILRTKVGNYSLKHSLQFT